MHELVREVLIDATPETVFPFLTETEKYLQWEGTDGELDPRPGGIFRVLIAGEYQSAGEFVEVVPNEKVSFTFGWEMEGNPITPGSTLVTITLEPEGTKTRLRLVHSGLPDEQAVIDHGEGWDHYAERLAIVATGGTVPPDVPKDQAVS
ncbi:MAG TPA: SRPBCC family protein [Acidimicrobiales bacterium]|nr:SRPBCC family protein [Acidimicrobiales bacterium]